MRTWRPGGLLLAFLHLIACGGDGDEPEPPRHTGPIEFEARHYDVALDLTTRRTRVDVSLRVLTAGDCVTIGLRTEGADAVALGGSPATGLVLDAGRLTACDGAGRGFAAGADVVLSVETTLPLATQNGMDVGFSSKPDRDGGTFTYLVSWLGGCDLHGPCDARPGAFATYRFVVAHAEGTQVFCPGTVTASPTETTCRFDHAGAPTYSTYAFMARQPAWTPTPLGTWAGVTATLHDRPGSMVAARFDTAAISGQFEWLVDRFGAFPYGDELRFVTAPTYWAGFEHPGNIALGDWLGTANSSYADGLTHTTMHELVHMWAGDHATLADVYDFTWKEAMAEYLTFVYEDEALGAEIGEKSLVYWKAIAPESRFYPVPEDQPRPALHAYYGDAYGPGPMIFFRQLEALYSRAQVLAALEALLGTGAPRVLSVDDVQAALEASTGADLEAYFQAWVHGSGTPSYPIATASFEETAKGSGAWRVRVATETADGVPRGCAFHVRLLGPAGEHADYRFSNGPDGGEYANPPEQELAWVPESLVVDPRNECLVYTAEMLDKAPPPPFWMHAPHE